MSVKSGGSVVNLRFLRPNLRLLLLCGVSIALAAGLSACADDPGASPNVGEMSNAGNGSGEQAGSGTGDQAGNGAGNQAGNTPPDNRTIGGDQEVPPEAGDNQAGSNQAGSVQAGDNQAGGNQAGDNQAGDNPAGDNQAGIGTTPVGGQGGGTTPPTDGLLPGDLPVGENPYGAGLGDHALPPPNPVTGKTITVDANLADNGTDDRPAIQAAIDQAEPGDEVYMPDGVYNILSTTNEDGAVLLKSGVNLRGESEDGVRWKVGGGGSGEGGVLTAWAENSTVENVVVKNLTIYSDGGSFVNGVMLQRTPALGLGLFAPSLSTVSPSATPAGAPFGCFALQTF